MRRRLFLDDDPARAAAFLARHPDAAWVETAAECVARLAEPWDEVHLDHDLGGEHFVESARADCGMEVVRWLTAEPRPHLARARFTVHSHNVVAAFEMTIRLMDAGFQVAARPFGLAAPEAPPAWLDYWRRLRFGTAARVRRVADRVARARVRRPHAPAGDPPPKA